MEEYFAAGPSGVPAESTHSPLFFLKTNFIKTLWSLKLVALDKKMAKFKIY
jgi:hypothetical protein